jgi:hypothetical protein
MTRTEILRLVASIGWLFAVGMLAAERRMVRRLRQASAASADTAVPLSLRSPLARLRLARLRSAGAVVEAGSGRYYLDAEHFHHYRLARRHRAIVLIALVIALFLVFWWVKG